MEEEISVLQNILNERNGQLQTSASTAEKVPFISDQLLVLFLITYLLCDCCLILPFFQKKSQVKRSSSFKNKGVLCRAR